MKICHQCEHINPTDLEFCESCGAEITDAPNEDGSEEEEIDTFLDTVVAGKYHIEKMIGRGAMGRVYKALQRPINRPVAIKILHQELMQDKRIAKRFQREAEAASRFSHPNSIGIFDFGQTDSGSLYIAMEYIVGKDLAEIISQDAPLSAKRCVHIAVQVLNALHLAHINKIIHRDLKPENIMLAELPNHSDFVKVCDFGIAKIQQEATDSSRESALTMFGMICGTPYYMSPEQARGEKLDGRSDLYSMGVILYEMLTGNVPFNGSTPVEVIARHLTDEPKPPSEESPDLNIPAALEQVVLRALSKKREDRFKNAQELSQALEGALKAVEFRSDLERLLSEVNNDEPRTQRLLELANSKVEGELLLHEPEQLSAESTLSEISTIGHLRAQQAEAKAKTPVLISEVLPSMADSSETRRNETPSELEGSIGERLFGEDDGTAPNHHFDHPNPKNTPIPDSLPSLFPKDDNLHEEETLAVPVRMSYEEALSSSKDKSFIRILLFLAFLAFFSGAGIYAYPYFFPEEEIPELDIPSVLTGTAPGVRLKPRKALKSGLLQKSRKPRLERVKPRLEQVEPTLERAKPEPRRIKPELEGVKPQLKRAKPQLERGVERKKMFALYRSELRRFGSWKSRYLIQNRDLSRRLNAMYSRAKRLARARSYKKAYDRLRALSRKLSRYRNVPKKVALKKYKRLQHVLKRTKTKKRSLVESRYLGKITTESSKQNYTQMNYYMNKALQMLNS